MPASTIIHVADEISTNMEPEEVLWEGAPFRRRTFCFWLLWPPAFLCLLGGFTLPLILVVLLTIGLAPLVIMEFFGKQWIFCRVTTRCVSLIYSRASTEVSLQAIKTLELTKGYLDEKLGTGTIKISIENAAKPEIVFDTILKPDEVLQTIRDAMELRRASIVNL